LSPGFLKLFPGVAPADVVFAVDRVHRIDFFRRLTLPVNRTRGRADGWGGR
jgi:hypothetical protein